MGRPPGIPRGTLNCHRASCHEAIALRVCCPLELVRRHNGRACFPVLIVMGLRACKYVLMAVVAVYATLVAFNNLTDYDSNLQFVRHVLAMDTTFPDNDGLWRAIDIAWMHHAAYALIIAVECAVAGLAWYATFRLWQARTDGAAFQSAKAGATRALTLAVVLWFGGFIAIGGEWFLMWQSATWNGIQAAWRIAGFMMLVMIFVNMEDE